MPHKFVIPGNIDLFNRPPVPVPGGGYATVRTMGIGEGTGEDEYEVNIPTVVGNRVVSAEDAIRHYQRTGQHLGKYPTRALAASMARKLHSDYAAGLFARQALRDRIRRADGHQ